jgi:hypothetical protein
VSVSGRREDNGCETGPVVKRSVAIPCVSYPILQVGSNNYLDKKNPYIRILI